MGSCSLEYTIDDFYNHTFIFAEHIEEQLRNVSKTVTTPGQRSYK